MSPGRIPWTAIDTWAVRNGISATEYEELDFLIKRMDSTYMDCVKDESEKNRQKAKQRGSK